MWRPDCLPPAQRKPSEFQSPVGLTRRLACRARHHWDQLALLLPPFQAWGWGWGAGALETMDGLGSGLQISLLWFGN